MRTTTLTSSPLVFTGQHDGVLADLYYDTRDPLAVRMRFTNGPIWFLPRDVFDPDLAPEPVPGADLEATWVADELRLTLRDDQGRSLTLLLDATHPALAEFIAEVFELVLAGCEHQVLDAQWERLLDDADAPGRGE